MYSIKELWIFDHWPIYLYLQISLMLFWKAAYQIMLPNNLYQICVAHYLAGRSGLCGAQFTALLDLTESFVFDFSLIYLPTDALCSWSSSSLNHVLFQVLGKTVNLKAKQCDTLCLSTLVMSAHIPLATQIAGHVPTPWSKGVYVSDRQVARAKVNKGRIVSKWYRVSLLLIITKLPFYLQNTFIFTKSPENIIPSW